MTYGSGTVREIPISEFDVAYENGDFFQIGDESVTLSYAYDGGKASFEVTGLSGERKGSERPAVTLEKDSYTYDGTAKTPGVTVMDGDVVIPAEEYTVTYTDNVKAGTASVTIADAEGGNYVIAEKTVTSQSVRNRHSLQIRINRTRIRQTKTTRIHRMTEGR